ncbi:MAG TPA: nucleotidyltransferase family protein [Bacillota bacterium]|nr:nucleotidyltransferase family protein [Bacillota bacterium]HPJ86224.1 nucleotidyltransferase family protein [Bacillota bacterium]HPQ62183.1 nucleotidyltransferase family protein [Bacillota bacterium]HRX92300.1 nucleotidyltransferase family protein [Candidatus Izemoplasmatales bacterium]
MRTDTENKEKLIDIIKQNVEVDKVINTLEKIDLPGWYVGAGCVVQSVWNHISGFDPMYGIKDIDVIYYDEHDLSYEKEDEIRKMVKKECGYINLDVDVINEARVHLWYKQKFGIDLKQYTSTEDAIDSWPSTASAIGIRKAGTEYVIYAPYGLEDAFSGIIRANKKVISKEIFLAKADKWKKKWEWLTILPW